MDKMTIQHQQTISQLVDISRSNKRRTFLLLSLALSSVTVAVAAYFPLSIENTFILMILVFLLSFYIQISSHSYQHIDDALMLEHINCTFKDFEQSSQLLLEADPKSILQQLQKKKIEQLIETTSIQNQIKHSLQPVQYHSALKILVISIILFAANKFFIHKITSIHSLTTSKKSPSIITQPINRVEIVSKSISIIPPVYTNAKTIVTSDMNLNVLEGSKVKWNLQFSRADLSYYLLDAEGKRTPLVKQTNGQLGITKIFSKTNLYSLAYLENGHFISLDEVYTVVVKLDQLPKIKIIKPQQPLVEIPKQGPASFQLTVVVTDDFGLSKTFIKASVASGSGEAVKFRDEVFSFDKATPIKSGFRFEKLWHLRDLKMEPGDEVYFKIVSEDNKQPDSQKVNSSSVIVRWLDNEVKELSAEGLQVHFVPEYFRSQRQIIIETEQLIEDRNDLSKLQFDESSRILGYSQSDLKTKYGQYLGDEVGGGSGEQLSEDARTRIELNQDHDDEHRDESQPESDHVHNENDRSDASDVIAKFAHNHGATEIGPMSSRDPKSWMKKAVKEMWQAELHLMLSEPEKALDFEYKAYDYLKLATAAERVYVKRLGFEPPPVNEDTRLKGELKDILSYSHQIEQSTDTESDEMLFQRAFSLLSSEQNLTITSADKKTLRQLKQRLLILSEARPALIKQAAIIQRMISSNRIQLTKCIDCVSSLKQKLWQLMPDVKSRPIISRTFKHSELDAEYQAKILQLKAITHSNQGDLND